MQPKFSTLQHEGVYEVLGFILDLSSTDQHSGRTCQVGAS